MFDIFFDVLEFGINLLKVLFFLFIVMIFGIGIYFYSRTKVSTIECEKINDNVVYCPGYGKIVK